MKLPDEFETFHGKIVLSTAQMERVESAVGNLTKFLVERLKLVSKDVFMQGSVPNGTAIKPDPQKKDGEYDVDLVVVCAAPDASPEEAINALEGVLAEHGTYAGMIERNPGRPCVRLRYADEETGGFHVDLTPARPAAGDAPLEIPRPGAGWRETAPQQYTEWCKRHGIEFARTVQMLKRWRDHSQTVLEAIKSILLQVLISENLAESSSDAERVAGTLRTIAETLAPHTQPPEIRNPVLEQENLADRWTVAEFGDFKQAISEAADLAERALGEGDLNRSRELWRQIFGTDFPGPISDEGRFTPAAPPPGRSRRQKAPRVEWG